jgi:outer membrane protein assembly factor BamB/Tfp pilus assembly protein PilF
LEGDLDRDPKGISKLDEGLFQGSNSENLNWTGLFLLLLCLTSPVFGQEHPVRRVAVMDFRNLTGDPKLDGFALGIPTAIEYELESAMPNLMLIERQGLDLALREMKLAKSQMISASTAPRTGKWVGADSLIVGEFQKQNGRMRLSARIMDVETGVVRGSVLVDGTYDELFTAQAALATKLVVAIQGAITDSQRKKLDTVEGRHGQAFQSFSDGLLFLRKNLAKDALSKFDLTLAIDPDYPGAHYYRAVALQSLQRLDEARDSLKQALPHAEPEQTVLWQTPVNGKLVPGIDLSESHTQSDLFARKAPPFTTKEIFYVDHPSKDRTALQVFDANQRTFQSIEVPEATISAGLITNDEFFVVSGVGMSSTGFDRMTFYLFDRDTRAPLWHTTVNNLGGKLPRFGLIGDAFYISIPGSSRIDLYDTRTGDLRWTAARTGLALDVVDSPILRHTEAFDDILILHSGTSYRAIRMSDGTDAWTVTAQGDKNSELVNDRMLVVFQPDRRIFMVDLETGKTLREFPIPQFSDAVPVLSKWLVGAVMQGSRLYVLSKDLTLYELNLDSLSIAWSLPLNRRFQSAQVYGNRLYLGMDDDEITIIDTAAGKFLKTLAVGGKGVVISNTDGQGFIAQTDKTLSRLSLDGVVRWQIPWTNPTPDVSVFNNVLTASWRTIVGSGLIALNFETGKTLWQYSSPAPSLFTAADNLFVLEASAVKQYSTGTPSDGISEKQTLAKLAEVLLLQSDAAQSAPFVREALAIDNNYAPAVLVHARLLQAEGNKLAAGQELARYATLVGVSSRSGQDVMAELRRDYGLFWHTTIGTNVAGEPVSIGNSVVSVGHRIGLTSRIVALNRDTGSSVWERSADRFVASAATVFQGRPYLWYVSGLPKDLNTVVLNRVDVQSGASRELARWKNADRVNEAWLVYDAGRVFVATTSPDLQNSALGYSVTALDAGTGTMLWQNSTQTNTTLLTLVRPVTVFSAHDGALQYQIGEHRQTVNGVDGKAIEAVVESGPKQSEVTPPSSALWQPASFTMVNDRVFIFTSDGTAYAVNARPKTIAERNQ